MPDPQPLSALEVARTLLISQGGGYLRNVVWRQDNCPMCAGIWEAGYGSCYSCPGWMARADLADRLGFVTYAVAGTQSGQVMYGYKEQPRPSEQNQKVVSLMLRYAVIRHWDCLSLTSEHGPLTHWATVPSLRGRTRHPLADIAAGFLTGYLTDAQLVASPTAHVTRNLEPSNFRTVHSIHEAHVLLMEDTWVGGGRVQSAAAALKAAGARSVTVLTLARWLDPRRGATSAFLPTLAREFNPDICPFTGLPC